MMWRWASAAPGGHLEMNAYKPLIIANLMQSIILLADGCTNFRKYLIEGTKPNRKKIDEYVANSLMLVTVAEPGDRLRQGGRDCPLRGEHRLKS